MQNEEIIDNFNKTVRKDKERGAVCWPWKLLKYELSSNYPLLEGRLKSLVKKFKNEELKKEYDDIISKQLQDSTKDYLRQGDVVHYIPQHAVVNENNAQKRVLIVDEWCTKPNKNAKKPQ